MAGEIKTYYAEDYPGTNGNEGASWWGGTHESDISRQLPMPVKRHGYNPELGIPKGYADRRSWLYKESAPMRAQQAAQLDNLRAYATGERSMAREQAARERDRQAAAYSSMAANAQRGGRSMAARQTSAYQAEQGARDIGAQSRIAQQLERQQAARAYMGAADTALKSQMGLEKLGRGYGQMGVQDKERWSSYRRGIEQLYGAKRAAAMDAQLKADKRMKDSISGGVSAGTGFLGALGMMFSDSRAKENVSSAEAELSEFLEALAEARR